MKKTIGLIGKILSVVFIVSAFLTWISYDYPNFAPFTPKGLFPSLFEQVGLVINWGLVVIQGVIGVYLWKVEEYLK